MDINERNIDRITTAETYFLRVGCGYRMADHKYEDIRKNCA
jgi:hypothetical protein